MEYSSPKQTFLGEKTPNPSEWEKCQAVFEPSSLFLSSHGSAIVPSESAGSIFLIFMCLQKMKLKGMGAPYLENVGRYLCLQVSR